MPDSPLDLARQLVNRERARRRELWPGPSVAQYQAQQAFLLARVTAELAAGAGPYAAAKTAADAYVAEHMPRPEPVTWRDGTAGS